ncbi:hypothetical protein ACGFRG_07930 [Streptomyces sp. NPDC048696]|uniref:hypothetical protein n=1 Tax=Streptomyces sp. NPDC048696 TaxID=3365585 RepID=UPI00371000DE
MTSAIDHLDTVVDSWADLQDALAARQNTGWPPAMGVTRLLDEQEREAVLDERADSSPDAPGPRPTPLAVDIFDVMRAIERDLVELADQLAERIQRPALRGVTGRGWSDDIHRQAVMLATKDGADGRRWRFVGNRDTVTAARWLASRARADDGPFRALTEGEQARLDHVAAQCAARAERALGIARRVLTTPHPCPHCDGALKVEGGDGQPPAVRCSDCQRAWTLHEYAA